MRLAEADAEKLYHIREATGQHLSDIIREALRRFLDPDRDRQPWKPGTQPAEAPQQLAPIIDFEREKKRLFARAKKRR